MTRHRLLSTLLVLALLPTISGRAAEEDYQQQIKPILRERCYACHGALRQEAGLRLDTAELAIRGGDSGAAIQPGDVAASLLLKRVTAADESDRMPPEGEPLKAEQVAALKKWITENAEAPSDEQPERDPREHWAFKTPLRPTVPVVANGNWVRNPIDAFLAKQHADYDLTPQPAASRAVLLRRLQMDLIGLPPTLAELSAFENDTSADWYESAVTRLLKDPRHGERWARHWMDIWRYSDWWGLGAEVRNSQQHIWHWRDWIVESLNTDTPYDEMVRQMLAADELYPNDLQKLRATGFLARNWFLFSRVQWMDETVEHVSKGFLGITMNCAKCHDHKYDPIKHADYYRMRAFFEPYHVRMDMVPNETDLSRDGIARAFDGLLGEPTYRFVRGDETKPDKSTVIAPGVPELLAFRQLDIRPVALPPEAWQPERRRWVLDAWLAAAQKKVDSAAKALTSAKDKLTAAQKHEPGTNSASPVDAKAAVIAAEGELHVAELTMAVARAELFSLQSRIAALRAMWSRTDAVEDTTDSVLADDEREKIRAAVSSEREVIVAKARHALAELELRLAAAGADQKEAIAAELKTAGESLEKATESAAATVADTDKFTPLEGAKWTTTRFVHPNRDDAPVTFPNSSTGRRSALADWITDPRNPLTARVAVNHLWARHLGTPLVSNLFELGRRSDPPANPELIDWLAAELVENGWSMKHVHRLIISSAAYRMSSSATGGEVNLQNDSANRYWWRRPPIRLESESLRDSLLTLAGELDLTMGGPPVATASQADSKRRSLYFLHSNNERNMFLTTFDEADVKECYRREQSIVPQQALALSNSALVLDGAKKIAGRLGGHLAEEDDATFVQLAFRAVLCVTPTEAELAACVKTMEGWRKLPAASPEQARQHLIWVLINHNDFVTVR